MRLQNVKLFVIIDGHAIRMRSRRLFEASVPLLRELRPLMWVG